MGELALLNVGTGDTKLTFDPEDKAGLKRTATIVKDMIKKGYAILVEVGKDEKGPLYRRAYDFDPKTNEYIIAGVPHEDTQEEIPGATETKPRAKRGRRVTSRVSAVGRKSVAVPRTAGG